MTGGHIVPLEQAVYCANPDAIETCLRICAAPDQVSIGVRLGSYLQAVSYFILVLVAPDEGGAESMWLGLSISFSFLFACFLQLYYGSVTLHHTVIIILLSHLPYISTLAGMNSLTSYEVLGPAGMRFLQGGMLLKSVLTALLWGLCLFAFYVGQLPSWTFLQFRQAHCFSRTSLVVWLYPVSPEPHAGRSTFLIASYSAFWLLVLALGSYWTLIAPRVLLRRGGHLRDPRRKKVKGFAATLRQRVEDDLEGGGKRRGDKGTETDDDDEEERGRPVRPGGPAKADPSDKDEEETELAMMTLRSISKSRSGPSTAPRLPRSSATQDPNLPSASDSAGSSSSLGKEAPPTRPPSYSSRAPSSSRGGGAAQRASKPAAPARRLSEAGGVQASRSLSPPPATRGMTALSPWSKGLRGSDRAAAVRWTRRQAESRHHFIIWPLVALLLVFVITTTELQMIANDVYPGEDELDFPGALTLALAIPTLWAVAKSVNRIREGRRPSPVDREDRTFWEMASAQRAAARRRRHRNTESGRAGSRTAFPGDSTDDSERERLWGSRSKRW